MTAIDTSSGASRERQPVRVRFAPSPTGYLHVGGARTALYNYLFAKQHSGKFILRIEDTDLERSTDEAMRAQIQDLQWMGLRWDEGPDVFDLSRDNGPHGPYRQSQRKAIYMQHAEQLLERGLAYYDFRTDEELEEAKQKAIVQGRAHQVERPAELVPLEEARRRVAAGEPAAVRFRVDLEHTSEYVLQDLIRGEVRFPADMVGDFVLLRSNGMPVYNFCCVVDDALMQISHVFRAEEHLSNTVRQLMIYQAFNYQPPQFGHLSIMLGPDRQKLSKRHGATSCNEYRQKGYLPEALANFIALCGWSSSSGEEILSMHQMIQDFDVKRLHAAAAVFDEKKLSWMNSVYLRKLSNDELWQKTEEVLKSEGLPVESLPSDPEWRERAMQLFKTSMNTLQDAVVLFAPLFDSKFELKKEACAEVLTWSETSRVWSAWQEVLQAHPAAFLTQEDFIRLQDEVKVKAAVKGKQLFMPIRVAVIGQPSGAELKELVPLLSKVSLLARLENARRAANLQ